MSCNGILILADSTTLDGETRKLIQLLLKHGKVLGRKLAKEQLVGIGRIAGVETAILHIGHALVKELPRDTQRLAESQRIQFLDIAHTHHHIIGWLIGHEQLAVAVIHHTTRRIYGLIEESIGVGMLLVLVVQYLQAEQTPYEYQNYGKYNAYNDKFTVFVPIIVVHL